MTSCKKSENSVENVLFYLSSKCVTHSILAKWKKIEKFKTRAVNEYKKGLNASEIHVDLEKTMGKGSPSYSTVAK